MNILIMLSKIYNLNYSELMLFLIILVFLNHTNAWADSYGYDGVGRLVASDSPDNVRRNYVYDSVGNRLSKKVAATTTGNSPPSGVTPTIASGATNVSTSVKLGWSAATDPNAGDVVSYYVYLGTETNPPLVFSGKGREFSPIGLDLGTTYRWKVVTKDTHNAETVSGPWTFKTVNNTPPQAAIEATVTEGIINYKTLLTSTSTSTDDAIVKYEWDISANGSIDSLAPQLTYTVTTQGETPVRLTVTDAHGATHSTTIKLYSYPDSDDDGIRDSLDNCPNTANPTQFDLDNDGLGDPCDNDRDDDGVLNTNDPAPDDARYKTDTDQDKIADEWEREYFNNLTTATAISDFDGDGSSDYDEFLYDSNPKYKPPFLPNKKLNTQWGHSLLVKPDGTLLAWGNNYSSQLGTGSNQNEHYANTVKLATGSPLTNVIAASAGLSHSLALLKNGTLMAWGSDYYKQLSNGTTEIQANPIPVKYSNGTAVQSITAIASGGSHSLALKSDGTVVSWGKNYEEQLGHGSYSASEFPALVVTEDDSPLTGIIAIAASDYSSFALRSDGTVLSWGFAGYGQLGTGNSYESYPARVRDTNGKSITKIHSIDVSSGGHALAVTQSGRIISWGGNYAGQLGIGVVDDNVRGGVYALASQNIPQENIVQIAAGSYHSLAISTNGSLMAWGSNAGGVLGDGTTVDKYYPTLINYPEKTLEIAAGSYHSLMLTASGKVLSWGNNWNSQLGNGTTSSSYTPTPVLDANGNALQLVSNDNDNDGLTDDVDPDDDNDGMPDVWEDQYGLNSRDPFDAILDHDNDGLSNLAEFTHGSNPKNRDSDGDGRTDKQEVDAGSNPAVDERAVIMPILQMLLE